MAKMKHDDMGKDKPMMQKVAKTAVKTHEQKMHKGAKMAKGGMVARGMGAARKSSGTFSRNG